MKKSILKFLFSNFIHFNQIKKVMIKNIYKKENNK